MTRCNMKDSPTPVSTRPRQGGPRPSTLHPFQNEPRRRFEKGDSRVESVPMYTEVGRLRTTQQLPRPLRASSCKVWRCSTGYCSAPKPGPRTIVGQLNMLQTGTRLGPAIWFHGWRPQPRIRGACNNKDQSRVPRWKKCTAYRPRFLIGRTRCPFSRTRLLTKHSKPLRATVCSSTSRPPCLRSRAAADQQCSGPGVDLLARRSPGN